ncbi:hypothetical protein HQ325_16545 [Rhodococcus sp. BP-349]|uniref:hypothetical protein n=1 Tax=unclassified Rhodococcus (in: high G+C Gram-positive bacteria) TaxID=192944 RepID=UPI001C9B11D4|nr:MULTISPECIES: hypothetical protein [unclassified Rhodococcus (in: high G+C Gram-positive bacteria)]MBY6540285.1 hypothetical protein [Rhodococcus sp. BP-363]MBY6545690.1 hypothetical protein [Rhodococcus sp. BP-369]MBY6564920.1 hypothetical protein [Rhodococcus sp. BP-370]MBY6578144.1 hypothetical protein [Rhodococcus sp. BP-364]MBY6587445.1 hypothetical protein [Rhodococcus sp. BP-358]
MTLIRDPDAALWLVSQNRDWWDLVVRGPLGFADYGRLLFIPDPVRPHMRESDVAGVPGPSETEQIAGAVRTLAAHTTTPDECFFLVWNGWGNSPAAAPYSAPPVRVVHPPSGSAAREYYVLSGTLDDMSAWHTAGSAWTDAHDAPIPAYIWPADRAWCVTNDVDPHFATIAGTTDAIDELIAAPGFTVVRDDPDEDPPRYE